MHAVHPQPRQRRAGGSSDREVDHYLATCIGERPQFRVNMNSGGRHSRSVRVDGGDQIQPAIGQNCSANRGAHASTGADNAHADLAHGDERSPSTMR